MKDIPEGYMEDARGGLIPIENVKPGDKLEDELVKRLTTEARHLSDQLRTFKAMAMAEVQSLLDLLAQDYSVQRGGRKGNVTLRSFNGRLKVQLQISEYISFGPQLQIAKDLVDECIQRWSVDANSNLKVVVDDAFQVNKQGRIDTARVLGLRRLDIEDETWSRAMDAISDAIRVTGTKAYIRFHDCDPATGREVPITLDLAGV